MRAFRRALADRAVDPGGRRWILVPYDQLSDGIGPLSREDPAELGIVLIECPWKAARRPYHRQKLALVLANLRHFALEQAERGVAVEHRVVRGSYGHALGAIAREKGGLVCMRPAERELRLDLEPLVQEGLIEWLPHEGWCTRTEDLTASQSGPPWRMDAFYRHVRRRTGILMDARGKPVGGKLSFDVENREAWHGEPPAPEPPRFEPDAVTVEVGELIEDTFARHPGRLDLGALPATRADAETLWSWALRECLPHFGPYEDAMSTRSRGLFHGRLSPLVNLHRLLPRRLIEDVLAREDLELRCREGFVRQVLGWREFVRHVHEATDGFRDLPDGPAPLREVAGDGGYSAWRGRAWARRETVRDPDGGAAPSFLGGEDPLPPAFWGAPSGLACLDEVVRSVWEEGWSHHITRLMVLSNLATLLDVSPRDLTDWFWVAYADAYDWVVEPNVLGMGTFAAGELMTTKPYVSGAAYIDRMGDYCASCAFDPRKDCPVTPLYWAFLARHAERLEGNHRLRMPLASLRRRAPAKREADRATFEEVRRALGAGEELRPGQGRLPG